jgi:glycerol-3-phosphate dehydrogenase (NAD(P)+)
VKRLAIVGGGGWGTALAIVLAPRFEELRLWVFEPDLAERLRRTRDNDVYLPGCPLPEKVQVATGFSEALEGAEVVLSVVPSQVTRAIYAQMLPYLDPAMLFVSAAKGIENGTLLRMSEVIRQVVGASFPPRVAALSGPTFAREVARGDPTALVIASEDPGLNAAIQSSFSGPSFRLYTNDDPAGVELAGSLKNVIALGAGVLSGLGMGHNVIAALITRGLAEITRLAVALGGRPATLAGLAGLGDLVLTSTGALSRNRQVGIELGRGRRLEEILGSTRTVAEGVSTTYAAMDLSRRCGVEMPIAAQVNAILRGGRSPREAIRELMERSLKSE